MWLLSHSHSLYEPQYHFWQFRKDHFKQSLLRVNEMEQALQSFAFLMLFFPSQTWFISARFALCILSLGVWNISLSLSCDSVSFLEFSKSPRWVIRWFWDNALCQFSRHVAIRIIRDCSDLVHEMNTEFHTLIYLASAWTFCLRWLFT